MFKVTKKADFAIRGMMYLGMHPEGRASLEEIAEKESIPGPFLAKILQTLSKKNLIRSNKGPSGGFMLLKPLNKITLLDVIEAVEGAINLNLCLVEGERCRKDKYCAAHIVWMECQDKLVSTLKGYTIRSLIKKEKKFRVVQ